MTEEEARRWTASRWNADVIERLDAFAAMVIAENQRQNLISPTTVPTIWSRHIVDSLQLAILAGKRSGEWLDIGSGGGFPGLVLAVAGCLPMHLVEPRRRRAEFLMEAAAKLGLENVRVHPSKVEQVTIQASVITARAVATVENLLRVAAHCGTSTTRWLLPRGSVDIEGLPIALRPYGLMFHVEQSLTHPGSAILILDSTS